MLPIGQLLRAQHYLSGNLILSLGLLILLIYFLVKAAKELFQNQAALNQVMVYVMLALMTVTIFAKYFYKTFWDYPSLSLIPFFIVFSLYFLLKKKTSGDSFKMKAATGVYLFFTIPLFLFTYGGTHGELVPAWWFRDSLIESVPVKINHSYQLEETETLRNTAYELWKNGQYSKAIAMYREALALEPNNAGLYFELAVCYTDNNELESAITVLSTAIQIDPNSAIFYNNRGLAHYRLYNDKQAIRDYQKAIEIDSTQGVPYANLALALYEDERMVDACECIRKAQELNFEIPKYSKIDKINNYCHQQNL